MTRRGYVVANVRFSSPERAQEYGRRVPAVIDRYGGRYLARGGPAEMIEGDWPVAYVTLIEFPSLDDANRWYESEEYRAIKLLRVSDAQSQIMFVEGLNLQD